MSKPFGNHKPNIYNRYTLSIASDYFFFKKELEIFIRAKFEDYNLGRASQKALRTVPPARSQDTVYISFLRQGAVYINEVLLTVYMIHIEAPSWWVMRPPTRSRRNAIFQGVVLLLLGECCSLWLSMHSRQWERPGQCTMRDGWG